MREKTEDSVFRIQDRLAPAFDSCIRAPHLPVDDNFLASIFLVLSWILFSLSIPGSSFCDAACLRTNIRHTYNVGSTWQIPKLQNLRFFRQLEQNVRIGTYKKGSEMYERLTYALTS
jgi:hypothetical protein